jgi:hypothetical protein
MDMKDFSLKGHVPWITDTVTPEVIGCAMEDWKDDSLIDRPTPSLQLA